MTKMQKENRRLRVTSDKEKSYDIVFSNSFEGLQKEITEIDLKDSKICIITDSTVNKLYGEILKKCVASTCTKVDIFVFPAGEENKNLKTVMSMYQFLIENHYTRKDVLIALGGGVVGDITGFVAASYLRGIRFIQVPTTLLSQVDSSIGGKTGVDFEQYKNMVGAFYMPVLVYSNISTLKDLDERQYASGFAEIMKSALIKDSDFYEWLLDKMYEINELDFEIVEEMIYRTCSIKKEIVEKDPKEEGERALLNFGHTLGHAIETASDFQLYHGECVALGCVAAAHISYMHNLISKEEYLEVRDMFVPFHLPITIDNFSIEEIIENTKSDKKNTEGTLKFILLKKIGEAIIDTSVSVKDMEKALKELLLIED